MNFCEVDKYAIKSYCSIHNVDESLNLGDISKVDETKLDDFNMMTWGFPCTDISVAGKQKGFLDESGEKTRSGMYYEGIRILREKKPALSIIENVKNLTGKRFKNEFETVLNDLEEAGYTSYWKVLNAKNFGVPQNRERVFIVSIRKDLDNGKFKFPEPFDNGLRLKDLLEDEVDEKFYISKERVNKFVENAINNKYCNKNANFNPTPGMSSYAIRSQEFVRTGFIDGECNTLAARDYKDPKCVVVENNSEKLQVEKVVCEERRDEGIRTFKGETVGTLRTIDSCGDKRVIEIYRQKDQKYIDNISDEYNFAKKKAQEMLDENDNLPSMFNPYNKKEITDNAPTQTASSGRSCSSATVLMKENDFRIRKLTPKECFRLMGFSDDAFNAAQNVGVSNSQLYKQAGNSIVVDVLYYIYKELYIAMPYLFDDLKLSSFFSGIGAFECGLNRLYEDINNGRM